jgi:pimeloyl-ACP methyl ester carboxylesterase
VTKKRTALISAGIAAGAIAAGAVGSIAVRRHRDHLGESASWDLPPDDLGPVTSFDGTEIAVRAAGPPDAPVLLFAHGFSLDGTTWFEQWMDLSVDYRCVVMDHRSHGKSGRAAHDDMSLRAMGRDIGAVLDAVSPDRPAVLVGHSMGAMAILSLAELRPELFGPRVTGVVLVGASVYDLLQGAMGAVTDLLRPRLGSIATAAQRVDRLRKALQASPVDIRGAVVRLTQLGPDAPQHVVDHVVLLAQQASSSVWTDGLSEIMEVDQRHVVSRVRVPALVVVGEHDRITPPAAAVELAGSLPDARLVVLEGAGHLAMLERPVELDRELRLFARSVLGADPPPAKKGRGRKQADTQEAEGQA